MDGTVIQQLDSSVPRQEIPDNGRAELLDANTPSGSGNEVSELPHTSASLLYEVLTYYYQENDGSQEEEVLDEPPSASSNKVHGLPRSPNFSGLLTHLDPHATYLGQNRDTYKRFGVFLSGRTSRESWTSMGSSDEISLVETIVSLPPRRKALNLDRSLPPTPLASPQMASSRSSIQQGLQAVASAALITTSASATLVRVPPNTPVNTRAKAFPRHQHSRLSRSSMEMEIVVPEDQSTNQASAVVTIQKEERRTRVGRFQR